MTEPREDGAAVALTVTLAVLGVFVTYVPITAVSISLTTIGQATGASTSDLQWVSDSYIIPMAATILSAGVFGDIHGRRRVYLIGMALTVVGATIAALAGTIDGRGGAARPLARPGDHGRRRRDHAADDARAHRARGSRPARPGALRRDVVDGPRARPRARPDRGRRAARAPAGGAGSSPRPGCSRSSPGVLAALRLPESRAPEGRHLDWPGQITATIAIAASIYGVIEGGQAGWGSVQAVAGLGIGAIALVAFIVVEARSTSPILNLGLFRSPEFSASGFARAHRAVRARRRDVPAEHLPRAARSTSRRWRSRCGCFPQRHDRRRQPVRRPPHGRASRRSWCSRSGSRSPRCRCSC